jgi:hypothetical protein
VLGGLGLSLLAAALAVADERAAVTFMGFQAFPDGTSRIFVHMTSKPNIDVDKQPLRVVFTLRDASILSRNNKNPLNLEHFATPAKRAQLAKHGDDVEFVVELKREVQTRHQVVDNENGGVSLHVDFPAP